MQLAAARTLPIARAGIAKNGHFNLAAQSKGHRISHEGVAGVLRGRQ
jgi:hypothetical protein